MSRVSLRWTVARACCGLILLGRSAAAAPPNDACSAATPITTSPFSDPIDLANATTEPGDTSRCGCDPNGHSVWYTISPSAGAYVHFGVQTSTGFEPVIDAFEGTCDAKTPLTCQVGGGGITANGSFLACGGRTYLIELSAKCANVPQPNVTFFASTTTADPDHDGVDDCTDNCPTVWNPGQEDTDGDGLADACDPCPTVPSNAPDADHDCVPDSTDNCPAVANPGQADFDGDGIGDACDDSDGDGVLDARDNCRTVPNPGQENVDRDGLGDACDDCIDFDRDGFGVGTCPPDNCPHHPNPDQADSDGDGIGDACPICGILGEAVEWAIIASDSVSMRESSGYHETTAVLGSMCTGKAAIQNVSVGGAGAGFGSDGADLVALAAQGTAVHARRPATGCYYCSGFDDVDGAVITGGGRIAGLENLYDPPTDTTGNHPRLADCRRGLAAARTASARLAALPPTHVFGDVHIGIGERVTIDARGGAVINMDSLRMESARQTLFDVDPVVRWCDSGDERAVATLRVIANEGDPVVINVPDLTLGTCAQPDVMDAVINVSGPGRPIRVGTQVGYAWSGSPVLLAPERKVSVLGSAIDLPPIFAAMYVRSLKTTGFVLIEDQWTDNLPCHPYR